MHLHTEIEVVQDAFTITQQNQVSQGRSVGDVVKGIVRKVGLQVMET